MKNQDSALPRGDEYVAALQHPSVAFRDYDLRTATIETRPNGLPRPYSGGFTMTFHAAGPRGEWAIRCFTRDVRELARRYDAIGRFTSTTSDPAFARAELIPDEILVAGRRRSVIKMEWIRGPQLNAYCERKHDDPGAMKLLAEEVLALGLRLEEAGIAHGDLQHGNVLVTSIGQVRLVDYDDLYLPELSDLQFSSGLGHQNFQHPGRTSRDFGPHMDRFSLYAIYVALLALAEDPSLWKEYDGGDERLLFKRDDYTDPENSKLMADLAKREALTEWIDRLVGVCHAPYAAIPAPADFLAGHFDYARFVPGGPRPVPPPPVVVPVFEAPPPEPPPPPPKTITVTLPQLPNFARVPTSVRGIDWITPAIVVVLLAVAGIFHEAIFRFAFPPPPAPAATDVAQPAAPRAPEHRAAAPVHAEHAGHVASAPKAAAPGSHAAARPASAPATANAGAGQMARPAATAPPEAAVHTAVPVKPVAAAPAHANPPAHVASAPKPKPARRRDATTALLDAAAGDVAAPRCANPDAPARVLSNAIPVVSKYRGAATGGGSADVSVSLSASGDVTGVSIANTSGSADLDAAALDAARRSSYRAGTSNCSPVASSLTLHVRF